MCHLNRGLKNGGSWVGAEHWCRGKVSVMRVLRLVLQLHGGQDRGQQIKEGMFQVPARSWQEQGQEVDELKMVV